MSGFPGHSHNVLDLGSGDSSLLALLTQKLEIRGCGVEVDDTRVLGCVQKGISVIQQKLEDGLRLFEDQNFNVAILLQTIHQTAEILRETVRVARECIVSLPNFGY